MGRNVTPSTDPAALVPALSPRVLERERRALRRSLRAAGRPGKHDDLRRYVGSPLPTLGVYARDLAAARQTFKARHPRIRTEDLHALSQALWDGRYFEERILACQLLETYPRAWSSATWSMTDRWIDAAEGWGLCDTVGGGVVSRLLEQVPARFRAVRGWAASENVWRRRAALYAMNRWVRSGQLDRPFALLRALYRDPAFWVRRAVGTWLRECWKQDRPRTEHFLWTHARALPPIVITVATERASAPFRARLRAKARGPPA
jgi:3-methyladenine DNA glycosylase AlkD